MDKALIRAQKIIRERSSTNNTGGTTSAEQWDDVAKSIQISITGYKSPHLFDGAEDISSR